MRYRQLGKTGLTVSEVGMGCNRLGGESHADRHWIDLVRQAVGLGVTVFDTAERYGYGRSEEILGRALAASEAVYIASKVSPDREQTDPYGADRIAERCEQSLRRLRRDCIDIYQLHSFQSEDIDGSDWQQGLTRLVEQGKIRIPAVSVNSVEDGIRLVKAGFVRVLQVAYNILDNAAEKQLLPLALERGVGILCRVPLARGVLTGKFAPGRPVPEGHRALLMKDKLEGMISQANDLRSLGESYGSGMTGLALHFALAPTGISAIIPGARTESQLLENVAASDGEELPAEMRDQIDLLRSSWASKGA